MNVDVSQMDVTNFLANIAQQYGMDPTQFITSVVNNGQLGSAVQEVGRSKALLAGMRQITFKDPNGDVLDLSAFLQDDEQPAEESESVAAATAAAQVADAAANADD
jgi:trigger factor